MIKQGFVDRCRQYGLNDGQIRNLLVKSAIEVETFYPTEQRHINPRSGAVNFEPTTLLGDTKVGPYGEKISITPPTPGTTPPIPVRKTYPVMSKTKALGLVGVDAAKAGIQKLRNLKPWQKLLAAGLLTGGTYGGYKALSGGDKEQQQALSQILQQVPDEASTEAPMVALTEAPTTTGATMADYLTGAGLGGALGVGLGYATTDEDDEDRALKTMLYGTGGAVAGTGLAHYLNA